MSVLFACKSSECMPGACGGQKWALDPLQLEWGLLYADTWVLVMKPGSSARVASVFNCCSCLKFLVTVLLHGEKYSVTVDISRDKIRTIISFPNSFIILLIFVKLFTTSFTFMCMVCINIYAHMSGLYKPEEGIRSLGTRVAGSCELQNVGTRNHILVFFKNSKHS